MLQKKPIKFWDVNVDDIAISKSIETITNSKYLIGYLDKPIKPLVLIVPKWVDMLRHLKLKVEINIKNNQLMSFHIDDGKILEKYKAICTYIEDFKI